MKVRKSFVSNSSSTSFLITVDASNLVNQTAAAGELHWDLFSCRLANYFLANECSNIVREGFLNCTIKTFQNHIQEALKQKADPRVVLLKERIKYLTAATNNCKSESVLHEQAKAIQDFANCLQTQLDALEDEVQGQKLAIEFHIGNAFDFSHSMLRQLFDNEGSNGYAKGSIVVLEAKNDFPKFTIEITEIT